MPYQLYIENSILRLDFAQVVTNEEFAELTIAVQRLESNSPVVPHRITDVSQSTGLDIKYPGLAALARLRKATTFTNKFKSAIVAPQPVHHGLARMFATLNDHPQITIRIFPTLAEAKAWIAED